MSALIKLPNRLVRLTLGLVGILFVLSILPMNRASARSGDLDPTFGVDGKVVTHFSGSSADATSLAVQPDGKIIAAGSIVLEQQTGDCLLVRYNVDGSLDTIFGEGGKAVTDFFGSNDFITDIAIQPDGKIVAIGSTMRDDGFYDILLARYNPDGSLDMTFGTGGKGSLDYFGYGSTAQGIVIQPDGKIVIGGSTNDVVNDIDMGPIAALARYNPDGSLDGTFGAGGKVVVRHADREQAINHLALQADGKIVATGFDRPGNHARFLVQRFNVNGSLDSGFGSGGEVTTDFFKSDSYGMAVVLQKDGRIVVGGTVAMRTEIIYSLELLRYNPDGTLDATFGTGGKASTLSALPTSPLELRRLLLQPDGQLLAIGQVFDLGADIAIVRFNHDGSVDTHFGVGGLVSTDFGGESNSAEAVVLQPNGRLVVGGFVFTGSNADITLTGYDTGFDTFDLCVQDDANGNRLQFSSATGQYLFVNCRRNITLTGKGIIHTQGCKIELQDIKADRNLSARVSSCTGEGHATLKLTGATKKFAISDHDITDNSRSCP